MPGQRDASREYVAPMRRTWWLHKRPYLLFMVRELTSVFVLAYAVLLLVVVARAGDPAAFERLFVALQTPWSVALHLIALAMVLFHAITWIGLTPKVLVLWRGEDQVSPRLILAANYLGWALVSGVVAWVVLR